MIQQKPKFTMVVDADAPSADFNIKQKNLPHLFSILRSNLYSNKILAVIREYSTNAMDANIDNGKPTTPIQVTIPSTIDPTFQIRDFGKGLTEKDVFEVYSSYGESTKRTTNKFNGTLGMGSKSGFAYSNSFTITSWNGGMKRIYEAFIDESNIGKIMRIHEEPSNEPTGVAVTISVSPVDISKFISNATDFYMWFDPQPEFLGYDLDSAIKSRRSGLTEYYNSDICKLYSDSSYNSYGSTVQNMFVRMGNICYPVIDRSQFDVEWLTSKYKLVIDVKIGEVSFTTSRESLEMTSHTINTIKRYLKKIMSDVGKSWQDEINKCKTGWEAICHYNCLDKLPKSVLSKGLTYKGDSLNIDPLKPFEICEYNGSRNKWEKGYNVQFDKPKNVLFIVNDGGFPPSQLRERMNEARKLSLAVDQYRKVYYLRGSIADAENLLKSKEFEGAIHTLLSTVNNIPRVTRKKTHKNTDNVFLWNGSTSFPYSGCWDALQTVPKGIKVYVNIGQKWKPDVTLLQIKNTIYKLKANGVDVTVYGVKTKSKFTVDKTYIHLSEYVKEQIDKILDDKSFIQNHMVSVTNNLVNTNQFIRNISWLKPQVASIKCPSINTLLGLSTKQVDYKYNEQIAFINYFIHNCPDLNKKLKLIEYNATLKQVDLEKEVNKCSLKYPLLSNGGYGYSRSTTPYIDYINAMHQYDPTI